ncbi:MAG: hypothetical protein ACLFTH_01895 [Candidatus Woesearchaeota archaeon]
MDLQSLVDKESLTDSRTLHEEIVDTLNSEHMDSADVRDVISFASLAEKYVLRNHPLHHDQRHNETQEEISPKLRASIIRLGRFLQKQIPDYFKQCKAYERILKHNNLDEEQQDHYKDVLNHLSADLSYLHHLVGETFMLSFNEVKPQSGFPTGKKLLLADKWFRNKVTAAFSILDLDPLTAAYAFDSAAKAGRNGYNITFDKEYLINGNWREFRKKENFFWADRVLMASSQTAYLFNQYKNRSESDNFDGYKMSQSLLESSIAHSYRRVGDAAKALFVLHEQDHLKDIAEQSYDEFLETAPPYLRTAEHYTIYGRVAADALALKKHDARKQLLEKPSLLILTPF